MLRDEAETGESRVSKRGASVHSETDETAGLKLIESSHRWIAKIHSIRP